MMKKEDFVQILAFPFLDSLTNAQIQAVNQEKQPDGSLQLVIYYLEFQLAEAPKIIEQDGRPAESLSGHYYPRRLRFFNVRSLFQTGPMAEINTLPPNHGVRTIKDVLHWELESQRHYVFFHNATEPAELHFVADGCEMEERSGTETAVRLTRNWAITPPLIPCCFPMPDIKTLVYGGDPIPIHLDGKSYNDRLIVGGIPYQGEVRPDVDAVLNLGEEPSKWSANQPQNPADRWMEHGEGQDGMSLSQITAEANWVIERLRQDQRVLVHCVAGFNRSVTVCCAVLIMLEGMTAEAALIRVREYHPWARPDSHHWLQLRWLGNYRNRTKPER